MNHELAIPEADIYTLINAARYAPADVELSDTYDLDDLWTVRCAAESVAAAARVIKSKVDEAIARIIGEAAVRLDDSMLRVKPSRTLRVLDADALFTWLGDDAREAFRADDVRITAVRAIAERRARELRPDLSDEDVTKRVFTVVDSLIEYEVKEDALEVVPVSRAPKFAAGMQRGHLYDSAAIAALKRESRQKQLDAAKSA